MLLTAKEKEFEGVRAGKLADLLLSACAALILALGSATAIAASHLDINCMESAVLHPESERNALLEIDVVDLTTSASADMQELRSADAATPTEDTNAPHLYLGPRVATIVRDVFGDEEPATDEELNEGIEVTPTSRLSPLVERTEPTSDSVEDTSLDPEATSYSPLQIHREMYRTDI